MNRNRTLYALPAVLLQTLIWFVGIGDSQTLADGYGSVTGQFVLDGDIPQPKLLIRKGDPTAKDPKVCAARDVFSDSLVVDSATKGIQHIFIYERRAKTIHPDLKASKNNQVIFDQKGCMYTPHTLLLRTDQSVVVKSGDGCQHNTHTYPIRNQSHNLLLTPNNRVGITSTYPEPELLPIQIQCDIHPWMKAYWLILDHPYTAITDQQGKFTIKDLPAGEHEFRVWHERTGYIKKGFRGVEASRRGFKVMVKKGKTTKVETVHVPVERFQQPSQR